MYSIRPETLTDKELESTAYQMWNETTGLPVEFQHALLQRIGERVAADEATYKDRMLQKSKRHK